MRTHSAGPAENPLNRLQEAMTLTEEILRELRSRDPGFQEELAPEALASVIQAMKPGNAREFILELRRFEQERDERLRFIQDLYQDDERASEILRSPAAPMVLLALERDPFRLKDAWARRLPLELLQETADLWGVMLP